MDRRSAGTSLDGLLMDDPRSVLDPIATLRIEELMQELEEDCTIFIVTHDMQHAARVNERTAFLDVRRNDHGHRTAHLVECSDTGMLCTKPNEQATEDFTPGRFG